jgi:hypothetical protein
MKKRNKLYNIDEIRLDEIFIIIDLIRGTYIEEIENGLDGIEDAVINFKNKWSESEDE